MLKRLSLRLCSHLFVYFIKRMNDIMIDMIIEVTFNDLVFRQVPGGGREPGLQPVSEP